MKIFFNLMNSNEILKMMNSMIKLPTPVNINMWWNFGSILGLFLSIQIISGLFLSMHYCPNVNYAFDSIIHIMKDVNSGWLIRLIHMNGASYYFLIMYIHIGRNMYYNSYKSVGVWFIGVSILMISMLTAFLGYVLPWGQMSLWGSIVITNLLTAIPYIGFDLVEWIWGGFFVNNATLNRFFALHFMFPFIIFFFFLIHMFMLHINGSNNPLGSNSKKYMISFHPYHTIKDFLGFMIILLVFFIHILQYPYILGDPDNFKMASGMVTPIHIKPEWYFLFAFSILRSIPNKLGGVIMLVMSIVILYFLPLYNYCIKTVKFYPINKILFWIFLNNFIILTWLGGKILEEPYILLNKYFSMMYFLYFILIPIINIWWDYLIK